MQMYLVIDGVDDGLGHSGRGRMWEIRTGETKGSPVVATCLWDAGRECRMQQVELRQKIEY